LILDKVGMTDPVVSIIVPTNRKEFWPQFLEGLSKNTTSLEILFVGPCDKPDFDLSENVRVIYTEVKPAQCIQIGIWEARGKYVVISADDQWYAPNSMDVMVERAEHHHVIPSCSYRWRSLDCVQGVIFYYWLTQGGYLNAPVTHFSTLLLRQDVIDIGGIDSNFISSYTDIDLALRLQHEKGYSREVTDGAVLVEIVPDESTRNSIATIVGPVDLSYIKSCWLLGPVTGSLKRLRPIVPFVKDNILEKSQGPHSYGGRTWK
jgi:hypothetical protein